MEVVKVYLNGDKSAYVMKFFATVKCVSKNNSNNYAFIDGANLHRGVKGLGWELDYRKFRVWLKEKYSVSKAYIFIGLISEKKDLYAYLQEVGYILIFKEITHE